MFMHYYKIQVINPNLDQAILIWDSTWLPQINLFFAMEIYIGITFSSSPVLSNKYIKNPKCYQKWYKNNWYDSWVLYDA